MGLGKIHQLGSDRPLNILTWHIHGSYLYYLTQSQHKFYLPVKPGRPEGYGGRSGGFPWGENVVDVPVEDIPNLELDAILFQSRKNYFADQYEILSPQQRRLARLYLEHDPPREHPTDTHHPVDDPEILLVHVTQFNRLMWDNNRTPATVIEHGVVIPEWARYIGEMEKGLVVVNNIKNRGRRLGVDIFASVRKQVPLDIVGIGSEELGGLGSIGLDELVELERHYRFFFNPIRYTSLGLAVCEAMLLGLPIVGLATTEMVTAVENSVSGYVDTNLDRLIGKMRGLLEHPEEARRLGEGARHAAQKRFNIRRFAADWDAAFRRAIARQMNGAYPVMIDLGE